MKVKALIIDATRIEALFVWLENADFFKGGRKGVGWVFEAGGGGFGIVVVVMRDFLIELFVLFQLEASKYCLRWHLGLKRKRKGVF